MTTKMNPYGAHVPSWIKHLITGTWTVGGAIVVVTLAWSDIGHDIESATKVAETNTKQIGGVKTDIKSITRSIGELEKRSIGVAKDIENIGKDAKRDREAQKERYDSMQEVQKERFGNTQKSLERILRKLDTNPGIRRFEKPPRN